MLKNITKTFHYNFARKIANKTITPVPAKEDTQNIQQYQEQFVPLPETVIKKQIQLRSKIAQQLSYVGQDPTPNKLVNRPAKGAVWGLGGQLVMASKKVQLQGLKANTDEIVQFLEIHQVKNIYLHDWKKNQEQQNIQNRRRYAIIGSCFSARHCWKTALQLKNAFNKNILQLRQQKRSIKYDPILALLNGKRDEQWNMVEYKDFQIHLMTQQQRQSIDLQWKWNNPVPEQVVEKWFEVNNNRKKRKNQFQDFN